MYKCTNGHTFDEPASSEYRHKEVEWGSEYTAVCPECGSDEFEEIVECECCGKLLPISEQGAKFLHFRSPEEYICRACVFDYAKDNFT